MIIKKEKENEEEIETKENIIDFIGLFKKNKKKIIIISILILVVLLSLIVIKNLNKDNSITIDIASTDIVYSYGPNASTITKLKVGQEVILNIITEKDFLIKCYSTNEDAIEFTTKNAAVAKAPGAAEIYCMNNKTKSNVIEVKVGE